MRFPFKPPCKIYVIVANGQPFFSVANPCTVPAIMDEARAAFGEHAIIEAFVQTTEPYEPSVAADDSK
jgi:hypothetical protein